MSLEQIIILASCFALALFLLTPFLAKKPWILRWLAKEIRDRDSHQKPTPNIGGIVTFLGFSATIAISSAGLNVTAYGLIFYFAMLGLIDDLFDIHGVKKIFLFFSGVCLYFAVFDISESLDKLPGGKFSTIHTFYILLSIVFLFVIINSSNTIDGIDHLCITYFIVNFVALSFLFHKFKDSEGFRVCAVVIILTIPFLFYNTPKATVFLGDCGSLFLGSLMSVLLMMLYESGGLNGFHVFLLFGGIAVLDNAVVSVTRMLNGSAPWRSDKFHIHHILVNEFGYWSALIILILAQCFIVSLTALFIVKRPDYLATLFMLSALVYVGVQIKHFRYVKEQLAKEVSP